MIIRDPILWALVLSTLSTAALLYERRRRSRLTALDDWAARNGMACDRAPGVAALATFEPLALLPPVVEVERLLKGQARGPGLTTELWLGACLVGNRHRPRRQLIGILGAPPDLPSLRVLPVDDEDAPQDQGFIELPAGALPAGYRAEGFIPLARPLTQVLGEVLAQAGPGWRVELRPSRLILATTTQTVEQVEALVELGMRLLQALEQALRVTGGGGLGGPKLPPVLTN